MKILSTCDLCKEEFAKKQYKSQFLWYGKCLCNDCYIEQSQDDE